MSFYKTLCITASLFQLIHTKDIPMLKQGETLDLSSYKTDNNSGIRYKIINQGTGTQAAKGKTATVHYTGWLLVGNNGVGPVFDSSKLRNQPFSFLLGQNRVIKGWEISVADMKVGETRIVILPPNLAYGSQRVNQIIGPNSTLIFEIELLKLS